MSRKNTARRRRPRYALPHDEIGGPPPITIWQLIEIGCLSMCIGQMLVDLARSVGGGF
jgi:hypothetical protein